jgi:hypothetical protein
VLRHFPPQPHSCEQWWLLLQHTQEGSLSASQEPLHAQIYAGKQSSEHIISGMHEHIKEPTALSFGRWLGSDAISESVAPVSGDHSHSEHSTFSAVIKQAAWTTCPFTHFKRTKSGFSLLTNCSQKEHR